MTDTPHTTRSSDGTRIAYDRLGDGPPIVLVSGAFGNRSFPSPLPSLLASHFTVFDYDRRGRNDSGDLAPYAVEREIEDLAAVVEAAGGSAALYGVSSGAVLALEAAAAGVPATGLALYEPPLIVDDTRSPLPADYVERLDEFTDAGRSGDAVAYFMTTAVGIPRDVVTSMRSTPMWAGLEAVAHTLAYDARIMRGFMNGKPLPGDRWASVDVPALVMDGGKSPAFQRNAVQALAGVMPNATRRTLEGQTHDVSMEVLAPVIAEFLARAYAR